MNQPDSDAAARAEQERKIQIVLAETNVQKLIAEGAKVAREEMPNGDVRLILNY